MKHLILFENFNQFPDVWNETLIRGSKVDSDEYVDDPSTREFTWVMQVKTIII